MREILAALPGAFIGAFLGALLGWLITHLYAKESEKQVRDVQNQLLKIGIAFAGVAEDRGTVEWVRDDKGNITFGRVIRAQGEARGTSTAQGTLSVTSKSATVESGGDGQSE